MADHPQLMELHSLFKHLVRSMTRRWNKLVTEEKVSITQFRMLIMLNENGQQKASELADTLGVTSGAVTGLTDKLILKGYAERHRDEEDRRVVYLAITEVGRSFVDRLIDTHREQVAILFGSLPDEDVNHLKRIFSQLLQQIEITEKE